VAIIVANENGDWWAVDENKLTNIFVLDTRKITDPLVLEEIANCVGVSMEFDQDDKLVITDELHDQIYENITDTDKLERLAWEYGEIKTIRL
jgi:predicted DsbA family dithiol-disulfide isomerase